MADGHTMPVRRGASAAALGLRFRLGFLLACCTAACSPPTKPPPPSVAPARVIAVTEGRLTLRTSAYLELLAVAAGTTDETPPVAAAELESAARALAGCSDDRCAIAAAAPFAWGAAYTKALPRFASSVTEDGWRGRASTAFVGIEAAHAALVGDGGTAAEVLVEKVATDLGLAWPASPVAVDFVAVVPLTDDQPLVPFALGARSRCFVGDRPLTKDNEATSRPHLAAILDCVLVHAMLSNRQPSRLETALVRELGRADGERAWQLVVLHAVAAVLTAWEPRHVSVYRRAALRSYDRVLDWLAKEWRGNASVDDDRAKLFAERFASEWRETRANR